MRYVVKQLWHDTSVELADDDALWQYCQDNLPWAFIPPPADTDALVARLNAAQNYQVKVEAPMGLTEPTVDDMPRLWRAAQYLNDPNHGDARLARVLHEGDAEAAALHAAGLPVTTPLKEQVRVLASFLGGYRPIQKAERECPDCPGREAKVLALQDEGKEVEELVTKAFESGQAKPVELGGKHSAGTMLVATPKGTLLLKPGSGRQSPAKGEREQPASQSQREVGFFQCLAVMGMDYFAPRADLLLIDQQQYAAMTWLSPNHYQTLEDALDKDHGVISTRLLPLLRNGTLHRLAAADWILGNADRNGGNVLTAEGDELQLIDQGSSLAGHSFDPAHDPASYVPAYLRVWCENYAQLAPEDRLTHLPRCATSAQRDIEDWLHGLNVGELRTTLERCGADPEPILARLDQVTNLVGSEPIDAVINRLWAEGISPA